MKTKGLRCLCVLVPSWLIFAGILGCLLYPSPAAGQNEPGGLYVSGKMTTEEGKVDGSLIKMTRNGAALKDYNVLPDGNFNLRFEFNSEYTLTFTRKGNFSQKMVINTQVPSDVLRRDRKFPPFPVDVNLFTEVKGVESTFAENATMKIYYSAAVDNFISDVYYNNVQLKKLIDQAILQSQSVKREADLLKRISAAELAEMKKEYAELMDKAAKSMDKKEYLAALDGYQSASRIFPDEQFPKDRIAEIKDLLAILGLQSALDSMMAKKASEEAEAKAKVQAEAEAKAQAEAKAEAQAKAKTEAEAKAKADAETEAKAKAEAEAKAQAEAQVKAKAKSEAEKARMAALQKAQQDSLKQAADADKLRKAQELAEAKAKEKEEAVAEKARMAAEEKARMEALNNQANAKYQALIKEADLLAADQKLVEAVGKFRAAMEVKPQESYPIQRIEEIRGIISKQQAEKKAYDAAIARGNQEFGKQLYTSARSAFQEAQGLKASEEYPRVMIARIDSIESINSAQLAVAEAEKNRKLQEEAEAKARVEAEKLKKAQELAEAKAKAEAEAQAKAEAQAEAEAKAKAEAEAEKARLAALQKARQDSVKLAIEADRLKKAQELAEAKAKAEAEAQAKAEAQAEAQAKAEAEKARLAALQKARQDSVRLALEAEQLRKAQLLAEARAKAEAELKAKAEAEAKAKAEAQAKAQAKAEAEALAKAQAEAEAKAKAETARLARVQALTRENQELYNSLIANGDQAFANKEYNVSRAWYYKALALLPEEKHPKERIDEINSILHSQQLSAADQEFQQYIDKGDEAFRNNQWAVSRSWYNKALGLKMNDPYSKAQLSEIQAKITEISSGNSLATYNGYVAQGDKALEQKQYNVARVWYLRAREIKPNDPILNGKLEEIRKAINNQ